MKVEMPASNGEIGSPSGGATSVVQVQLRVASTHP